MDQEVKTNDPICDWCHKPAPYLVDWREEKYDKEKHDFIFVPVHICSGCMIVHVSHNQE